MYPVMLSLQGRSCLVVGGGAVALRKVEGLLHEQATVTVVAARAVQRLHALAQQGAIVLETRAYQQGEASSFALVFAATDDRAVNRQVFDDACAAGLWVNVADDPELCTFHLPARVQRGPLQLAIASDGKAPFATRRLRQLLERRFGQDWQPWLHSAARLREMVRAQKLAPEVQEAVFKRFFDNTVNHEQLTARSPGEAELNALLRDAALTQDDSAMPVGMVSLVGAGPGDAGLLTLRGRARVLGADAVVFDRLAEPALPIDLPAHVELRDVGKRAGRHPVPQPEISALLIELARQGKRVVRFKGGDPYVFGRGGEEALALVEAGVPFEIVPGVTSGVAASAYAGIPVTQRGEATCLTLVTAHESEKDQGPQVRWDLLGQDRANTIVGYMGVASLPRVIVQLLDAGMASDTPAAMIQRGTTSAQRSVISTISGLVEAVERAGLKSPALFVIGPAVRLCAQLGWFENRPLHGARVALSAPAGALGEALELLGVEVISVPAPLSPAATIVLHALPLTAWIARSVEDLELVLAARKSTTESPAATVCCVGEEVAAHAATLGLEPLQRVEDPAAILPVLGALRRQSAD